MRSRLHSCGHALAVAASRELRCTEPRLLLVLDVAAGAFFSNKPGFREGGGSVLSFYRGGRRRQFLQQKRDIPQNSGRNLILKIP